MFWATPVDDVGERIPTQDLLHGPTGVRPSRGEERKITDLVGGQGGGGEVAVGEDLEPAHRIRVGGVDDQARDLVDPDASAATGVADREIGGGNLQGRHVVHVFEVRPARARVARGRQTGVDPLESRHAAVGHEKVAGVVGRGQGGVVDSVGAASVERDLERSVETGIGNGRRRAAPGVGAPSVSAPSVSAPGVGAPSVGAPSVGAPSVGAPSVGAPSIRAPSVGAPSVGDRAPIHRRRARIHERMGGTTQLNRSADTPPACQSSRSLSHRRASSRSCPRQRMG